MTQTLGALIASGDFTGYEVQDATWQLDAQQIESLVYGHDYGDYEHEGEHCSTFYKAEKMTAVQLHTWLCTDQYVGLELFCLGGTPLLLSWQTGRKSDRHLAFLSEASRDVFAEAWERHRPAKRPRFDIVSELSLALPLAGPDKTPFDIDRSSSVSELRLSMTGIRQWVESIEPDGGIAYCDDITMLQAALDAAEADIVHQTASRDRFDDIDEDRKRENAEILARHKAECEARIAEVKAHLVEPLTRRLGQITATNLNTAPAALTTEQEAS